MLSGPNELLHTLKEKLPQVPNTTLAVVFVCGLLYSSTREGSLSATNRFPLASTATPCGLHKLSALTEPQLFEVKLPFCPKTRSAVVSVERGVVYSSTRL